MPALPSQTLLDDSACYVCLGVSLSDALALALWDRISQEINPSPPGETFFILTELGDILNAENNDRLETELAP